MMSTAAVPRGLRGLEPASHNEARATKNVIGISSRKQTSRESVKFFLLRLKRENRAQTILKPEWEKEALLLGNSERRDKFRSENEAASLFSIFGFELSVLTIDLDVFPSFFATLWFGNKLVMSWEVQKNLESQANFVLEKKEYQLEKKSWNERNFEGNLAISLSSRRSNAE